VHKLLKCQVGRDSKEVMFRR